MQISYMVFTFLLANKDLRKICSFWGQRNFPVYESFSRTTGAAGLETELKGSSPQAETGQGRILSNTNLDIRLCF